MRDRNTKRDGSSFTQDIIDAVWSKATVVPGNDSNVFRRDLCGAWIQKTKYGDTTNVYGWEIDHINPVSKGGGDELSNLQPLQWQNNRAKGDDTTGNWECAVTK